MRTPAGPVVSASEDGRARTWAFDFSPLGQRMWWAAVALLLINDNLLKGRGVVPGWLTGKLSDFAFMVVAPVLLTTLVPLRVRGRRWLAFAAVASVYAAADLSATVSDAVVALAGRLGLRWRLWPDVTDLVALAVLPASWRIAGVQGRSLRPASTVVQTAGFALGIFACLATSYDPGYPHYPFFVNRTAEARTVSMTWLLRKTDCDVDLATLASGLRPNDLDDPRPVTAASGQVAALDGPPSTDVVAGTCQSLQNTNSDDPDCMGVIVSVESGPAVLVSARRIWHESSSAVTAIDACWKDSASPSRCEPAMSTRVDPGPDALSLVEADGQLRFRAGSQLKMVDIDLAEVGLRVSSLPGCRDYRAQIQTLLGNATACALDSDCQTLNVDLGIPGSGMCNVHVNRSISSDQLAQLKARWTDACEVDDTFDCRPTGHPPRCLGGTCGELCEGISVPWCPRPCTTSSPPQDQPCSPATTADCLSADGQRCACTESGIGSNSYLMTCKAQPEIPGCSVRCIPTVTPVDASAEDVGSAGG
jgi:hypothetical protein